MNRFAFREQLSPYLIDDCINIIIEFKNEMEYFDELNLIYQKILYQKNKKKVELKNNINLKEMIFHLDTFHYKLIKEYNFHLYIYDNYSFCNTIRLNYDKLKDYSKESLNISSIHRINNKRILLVLDEDYTKLDNISKIGKGFKYYIKRCTNFIYIKMNIAYIKLCFIRT
jgi:hypothetical protein